MALAPEQHAQCEAERAAYLASNAEPLPDNVTVLADSKRACRRSSASAVLGARRLKLTNACRSLAILGPALIFRRQTPHRIAIIAVRHPRRKRAQLTRSQAHAAGRIFDAVGRTVRRGALQYAAALVFRCRFLSCARVLSATESAMSLSRLNAIGESGLLDLGSFGPLTSRKVLSRDAFTSLARHAANSEYLARVAAWLQALPRQPNGADRLEKREHAEGLSRR